MRHALSRPIAQPVLLVAALVLADAVILGVPIDWLRLIAGLALVFVLPGCAWLCGLNWLGTRDGVERSVLLVGMSGALAAAALLVAVYWPQPLDLAQVLIVLNAATVAGLVFSTSRHRPWGQVALPTDNPDGHDDMACTPVRGWTWPTGGELIALVAILAVAIFLRWYMLGYGEFHEDEIENMRLAVRAMKGEEYAPFMDSKGPIHWLLPAALWLIHGWVNEALARAPFAISSTLTVLAVYALGRRVAGPGVGLIGAAFVAINGLLVAYARHVENPSLIVFWGVLAAWCAYRYYETRCAPPHSSGELLVVGCLFLGIGLVAHPNMVLYIPPFVLMVGMAGWQNRSLWRHSRRALMVGIGLFLVLVAAFYVPFVRDPDFKHTVEYFSEERVGTGILYNQVLDLLQQESEYSSRFYTPLLVLLAAIPLFGTLLRAGRAGPWWALGIGVGILTTLLWPSLWVWAGINAALVPYAVLVAAVAFSRGASFEVRSLVLWFGIPYLALVFLARDAATHIRNVHPFWALLAGIGGVTLWKWLSGSWQRTLRLATAGLLGICLGASLFYEHLQYLGTVAAYWEAEANARYADVSVYRLVYGGLPRPRKLVSNPRLSGWKVIGVLYDRGDLQGDFRTIKESFAVPIWYTHQTPRSCYDDPQNYFVAMGARGLPEEIAQLPAHSYGLTRQVMVDDQPRLFMLEQGQPADADPMNYRLDDYAAWYDHSATPERYTQEPPVQHPRQVTFGGKLLLRGYDIATSQIEPGGTLALSLHWQALAPMTVRYRVFVHVETDRMWGQHDDDPVCRLRSD
jgi:4-amino-4-deoxy-L-arabinose transferase-like glycosyltransferase